MSQQIAEFYAKITADTAGIQKGLADLNAKLDAAKTKAEGASGKGGQSGVNGLVSSLKSMINPTTLAVSGLAALTAFLKSSVAAAAEAAKVDAKLGAVIKSTGGQAGVTARQVDDMSTAKMRMTGVDDEVIKNASAVMLTFTQIGKQVFPDAIQSAMDMSAVLGTDLQGSVIQLGKALNVSAGDTAAANMGMTALRRSGVSFTDEQKQMALQMVKTGDIMGYQKLILAELTKEFGGAAQAMFEAGDKSEATKNAWENFKEVLGNQFLPMTRQVNTAMAEMIDTTTESMEASNKHYDAVADITALYGLSYDQMVRARKSSKEFNSEFEAQVKFLERGAAATEFYTKQVEANNAITQQAKTDYAALTKGAMALTESEAEYQATISEVNKTLSSGNYMREQYKAQQAELKQQLKDGAITQREYDAATVDLYRSWSDGSFKAKEYARAMGEIEKAQDAMGTDFAMQLLQGMEDLDPQKLYDFAAAAGKITKQAAEQYKGQDTLANAFADGTINADQYAAAIKALSGNLAELNGMSVSTYVNVIIRTRGGGAYGGIGLATMQAAGNTAGASSLQSQLMQAGQWTGYASGGVGIGPGMYRVGEAGEEGMIVNGDGTVTVVPHGDWRTMKKWGIEPNQGFMIGGSIGATSGGTQVGSAARVIRNTGARIASPFKTQSKAISPAAIAPTEEPAAAAQQQQAQILQASMNVNAEASKAQTNVLTQILATLQGQSSKRDDASNVSYARNTGING